MKVYRLAALAALVLCTLAGAQESSPSVMPGLKSRNLMSVPISPEKTISRVEIKEVTLDPMRKGSPHLHPIPVFNVIEEGSVTFQVEGQPVQHLKAGDVFYEPANAPIARLDNEGATPVKLVALYMAAEDDHELIRLLSQEASPAASGPSRKALATTAVSPAKSTASVKVNELTLEPKRQGPLHLHPVPVFTVIEEGEITFQVEGQPVQHLKAGDVFFEAANMRIARVDNEQDTPAKLALFYLLGTNDHELVQRLSK